MPGSFRRAGRRVHVEPHIVRCSHRAGAQVLSIAHWERIERGELYAPISRVQWATLLKRTFDADIRVCIRCSGRLTVRAVVTDPAAIEDFLAALRRARDPPAAA